MPDLVPVDYDPFGGREDQSQSYGGPDPAQRMRELEQPGRDRIEPVSMLGEPAGAKDAADFAGQFGTTVALGTGIGQAARFAAPYVGRAASAGYQTMRDVMGDINGGMPLDKLGRINQLTGDRLAGETGGRSAGEPSRSFSDIASTDRGDLGQLSRDPQRLDILDNGQAVGTARVSYPAPGLGYVDSITGGKIGETAPFGPRAVRDVARQYFLDNPDIAELQGWRVSGARHGADNEGLMMIGRDDAMRGYQPSDTPKYRLVAVDYDPQF